MHHRPVPITPPARLPVTLAEAKSHLRVDHDDEDLLIAGLIGAATEHLDGWVGVLGQCLVDQVWRQDFDGFARDLCLPLGPVIAVVSVTWRGPDDGPTTVPPSAYSLRTDAAGRSSIRFHGGFPTPGPLHEVRPVAVTYRAGYETIPGEVGPPEVAERSSVPDALKVAILLLVAHLYNNREATAAAALGELPMGVSMLISPYRKVGV